MFMANVEQAEAKTKAQESKHLSIADLVILTLCLLQLNRFIFHEDCTLSWKAKWFYCVLHELEHRYTGPKQDFFFRDQSNLSNDTGMTVKMNIKCRKELVKKGFLETWKMHWIDKKTRKLSEKHVTAFRLIDKQSA